MGVGNWYGRRKRRAELSIYLALRSVFWRIVFDWLPSDTKRALSCEMHQDFGANARVPPKSAPQRLENTSSAASWRSPYQFPTPIFPHTTYITQSVPSSAKPKYNAFNRTLQNVLCSIRACLKIHSCHLHAPLCGRFAPNWGCVARYAPFIRDKSTTNCDAHLSESSFQARSDFIYCEDFV